MKKLIHLLTSTRITLLLLLAFAASMAVATFVENDHGTATARALVYEAWWFELIMVWMAVNFLMHVRQYRLFSKGKWPVGLFHMAFVIIVLGAGVTRDLPSQVTAFGVPARIVGEAGCPEPARSMDQILADLEPPA